MKIFYKAKFNIAFFLWEICTDKIKISFYVIKFILIFLGKLNDFIANPHHIRDNGKNGDKLAVFKTTNSALFVKKILHK